MSEQSTDKGSERDRTRIRTGISFYPEVHVWLKRQAEANDRTLSYMVNQFILALMEEMSDDSEQKTK